MLIRKKPIHIEIDRRLNIEYGEVLCYTRKKFKSGSQRKIIRKVKVFPNTDLIKREKQLVKVRITHTSKNYYNGEII